MRTSTHFDNSTALEELAPCEVITRGNGPIVMFRRGPAGNDATSDDQAIHEDEAEAWARHALAANGFGATTDAASSERPTSYVLHRAARAQRSFVLGSIVIAAIQAAFEIVCRALARYRRRREAAAIYDALRQLDDRTLRDLGFDRGEIRSVAAELTGEAERTRVRTLWTSHGPPQ